MENRVKEFAKKVEEDEKIYGSDGFKYNPTYDIFSSPIKCSHKEFIEEKEDIPIQPIQPIQPIKKDKQRKSILNKGLEDKHIKRGSYPEIPPINTSFKKNEDKRHHHHHYNGIKTPVYIVSPQPLMMNSPYYTPPPSYAQPVLYQENKKHIKKSEKLRSIVSSSRSYLSSQGEIDYSHPQPVMIVSYPDNITTSPVSYNQQQILPSTFNPYMQFSQPQQPPPQYMTQYQPQQYMPYQMPYVIPLTQEVNFSEETSQNSDDPPFRYIHDTKKRSKDELITTRTV